MNRSPFAQRAPGCALFSIVAVCTLLVLPAGAASAQSLNAFEAVCRDGLFFVNWEGPNGPDDRIVLYDKDVTSGEPLSWRRTANGSPVLLRAPDRAGEFEIRYLAGGSGDTLVERDILVGGCEESGDNPNRAVLLTGTQIDYGTRINRNMQSPYGGPAGFTIDEVCDNADTIAWAASSLVAGIEVEMIGAGFDVKDLTDLAVLMASMGPTDTELSAADLETMSTAPSPESIANDFATMREELCNAPPPETVVHPFTITYASCRMTMTTPTHALDIQVPPGGGNGAMWMADHTTGEAATASLRRDAEQIENLTGQGWSSGISMSPMGAEGERAGHPVRQYSFKYTAGLGGGNAPLGMMASMITAENEGTAWMAYDVPGIDIVESFYQNLTNEVSPSGGASFFGGLINSLVGMLQYGLPFDIEQEVKSKVMGQTAVQGRSRNIITSIRVVDTGPDWCYANIMPDDYTVTDIDAQMDEAMSAAGASDPQMQEAMQQYQEAMENMTPEQQAMMANMGLGDMMNQMGAAGAATAPAASQPDNANRRGGSSSSDLMTGDLTESVQNHLDALGYDVGRSGGNEELYTQIAISQFQAEMGMEVTGEVTPQLMGVLAAEVDSRQ